VSAYTINAGSGALSRIDADLVMLGVQDFPAGTTPASVTVDPTGRFAYVANSGSTSVSAYAIDASSGALTSIGSVLTEIAPSSVTADPSGKFAYVANRDSNTISGYTINSGTGLLTAFAGSSFTTAFSPRSVAVDPSGKFAYTANFNSNSVSVFSIDASTGALTNTVLNIGAGNGPASIVTSGSIQ
jgi:6-phosphogluconolactonase (cycloisomerase 2 family)